MRSKVYVKILLSAFVILFCSHCKMRQFGHKSCKIIERPSPFIVYFTQQSISGDTLIVDVHIYNHSDSTELMSSPYIHYEIINDTSLRYGWRAATRSMMSFHKYDKRGRDSINCTNCLKYYSQYKSFTILKGRETYTRRCRYEIMGLSKKKLPYSFLLGISCYFPKDITLNCPYIWSGTINTVNTISK